MRASYSLARRALLAALLIASLPGSTEVSARLNTETGNLIVSGLNETTRARLLTDQGLIGLHVNGLGATRGMPLTIAEADSHLRIEPGFALRSGTNYILSLDLAGEIHRFEITPPAQDVTIPTLIAFAPSQAVIPANTLRLYLHFSEPMARSQLRDAVRLFDADGIEVASPFLTLGPELWDNSQTRVTLLFDPGRIKQGVGPNTEVGPPLEEGRTYRLVVSGRMESAQGVALGEDTSVSLRVGVAERRPIEPDDWEVLSPPAASHAPLSLAFDRIMDSGAALRLITLQGPDGQPVRGQITSDGGGWSLIPDSPWQAGSYSLIVDPELEDVSGNTIVAPFDAAAGTIGIQTEPVILTIEISAP